MDATFEVIRFQLAPAAGDVAVVELEGRPADPAILDGRVVLRLEHPAGHLELRPVVDPEGGRDDVLRATFAAPLEVAADPATTYALETGRGPVVVLPAPDGVGDVGLEVRLARTVNALRGELSDARRRLGGIVGNMRGELAAERESAGAERDEAVAAERTRLESELAEVRGELGDAQAEAEELRAQLADAHARISELEATLIVPRAPRVPRGPRPHAPHTPRAPRPPRVSEDTEEREPLRRVHASLGRSTARVAMLVVLALALLIVVVVVLQVRVLN